MPRGRAQPECNLVLNPTRNRSIDLLRFGTFSPPDAPVPMRTLALLFGIILAGVARAESTAADVDAAYEVAHRAYHARRYTEAAGLLEALLKTAPTCARCAHLLGKSYGRLAQRADWITAMSLARKTCKALELAVELDPSDDGAVDDLMRYYRSAPGFLGGGSDKLKALEQRLQRAVPGHQG